MTVDAALLRCSSVVGICVVFQAQGDFAQNMTTVQSNCEALASRLKALDK